MIMTFLSITSTANVATRHTFRLFVDPLFHVDSPKNGNCTMPHVTNVRPRSVGSIYRFFC